MSSARRSPAAFMTLISSSRICCSRDTTHRGVHRGILRLNVFRQLRALHRDLLAGFEVFECELVRLHFILAEDQREARVELAGSLERLLQFETLAAELDHHIVPPQLTSQPRRFPVHPSTERRDV